ncbi:hypothetical protein NSQ59_06720 [Margalitia sp. FSL K6-0131]|uniref:hypothetical protein n=1 Tax=Margalitia sp. FSL K6-0131 TaxID=2954604 RepID=UPI0030F84906
MSAVHQLLSLTKKLYEVSKSEINTNVDEKIHEINDLLEKREAVLSNIDIQSLNDEEKKYIKEIVEMDSVIKEHCQTILSGIKEKISNLNKSKNTQHKYRNPYSQVNQASRFFDKKN